MAGKAMDLSGSKHGRLTVLTRGRNTAGRAARWLCKCDCGSLSTVRASELRSGGTKSCGCLAREVASARSYRHGLRDHPLYATWANAKRRCYSPKHKSYRWYGAKGITVCKEWREDFQAFYDWAIAHGYKQGLTIDRRRNSRGYSPSNCRFITNSANAGRNRHKKKASNTSGHCGVYLRPSGKWRSQVRTDKGTESLGTFSTKAKAIAARVAAGHG